MKQAVYGIAAILFSIQPSAWGATLEDDLGTVGLWHMESIYYDASDLPYTADHDAQHEGRDHDLLLFRPGLNEAPPTVIDGYRGSALLFEGGQFANCPAFWSSSYSELKLECMLYFNTMPTELGAATTYLFTSSVFEIYLWPGSGGVDSDQLIFKVIDSSGGKPTVKITVGMLKYKWLSISATYDINRNQVLSITDVETGQTLTASGTGAAGLRKANSDITFGSTSPSVGSKPANRNFRGMIDELKISNCIEPAHHAYNPVPRDGSIIYEEPYVLKWSRGLTATMSDLYFSTDSALAQNAVRHAGDIDGSTRVDLNDFALAAAAWQAAPQQYCADLDFSGRVDMTDLQTMIGQWLYAAVPGYIGGTLESAMCAPSLSPSTTYYWRADSSNCGETAGGELWHFTTGAPQAFDPLPAHGAASVATQQRTTTLSWQPGFRAERYNVYFGTSTPLALLAQTESRTVQSPQLNPGTAYRWRVDAVSPAGTAAGTDWQFTTGAIGAVNPSPANGAADVKYPLQGVELAWESVFAPALYEVYFGTQNPPAYLDTVTNSSVTTPAVTSSTTYYWQVRCISEFGSTTGPVWQFTTATPAFPTAEGFGMFAKGGRGGSVYHVTNLNDSGTGSFRDAVSASDRTIVFDVGGQIVLTSRLGITRNRLTIAGQTAPGDGISIAGRGISIGADDLIMRYVRVRYTDTDAQDDALSLNDTCDNVILDHISVSWGTDEVLSINKSRNVTVQWSMITEGQNVFDHSKGSLLEMPVLTWHHNLFAHNNDRNPKNKGLFDFRNNVAYNWGFAPYIAGGNTGAQCHANCIANYYIAGPSTTTPDGIMVVGGNSNYHMYFSDNRIDWNRNGIPDGADLGMAMLDASALPDVVDTPYAYPYVATDAPQTAYQRVLQSAGCSRVRDAVDTRIVSEVISGTGSILYSYEDAGGLPPIAGGPAPLDTDGDGMPDAWETAHSLDIHDAADRNDDADSNGYTNLEEYLNSI